MTLMPISSPVAAPELQAATLYAGYTLVNGTGTVLQWVAPNDGKLHRFQVFASMSITSPETGGDIQVQFTVPSGATYSFTLYQGDQGAGYNYAEYNVPVVIGAGTTVTVSQAVALTAGAAVLWAEIWGS